MAFKARRDGKKSIIALVPTFHDYTPLHSTDLAHIKAQRSHCVGLSSPDGKIPPACCKPPSHPHLLTQGHSEGVWSVAWSPDGKIPPACCKPPSHPHLLTQGHSDGVWSVTWSPDGKKLATCSADGTAKIWDSNRLQAEVCTAQHTLKVWERRGEVWR